jgi:hypothetical protein
MIIYIEGYIVHIMARGLLLYYKGKGVVGV